MRIRFLFLILLIGMGFQPAWNQTVQIEELKAETLLKLLSQNRSLKFSQIDTVRMALVYDRSDSRSQSEAENYRRLFLNIPNPPFKGKPLQIRPEPNNRLPELPWGKIMAVVIIPGKNNRLSEILRRCSESDVLSMATDSTLIVQGVSVAVEIDYKVQPIICFNLTSLESEGAAYDAKILQLAKYMIWK